MRKGVWCYPLLRYLKHHLSRSDPGYETIIGTGMTPCISFFASRSRNGSGFNGSMVRIQEGQHGLKKMNKMQNFQVLKESDVLNGEDWILILELGSPS